MNLIILATQVETRFVQDILKSIRMTLPTVSVKLFNDCHALREWLQIPPRDFFAALLFPGSCQVLDELVAIKAYFVDRKILLVIPETDRAGVALGHQLNPGYCCRGPGEIDEMVAVLQKWLADERAAQQWIEGFASVG